MEMTKWRVICADDGDWDDAVEVDALDAEDAAWKAAPEFYDKHDGWEWMPRKDVLFLCRMAASEPVPVVITTEFEPVFYARQPA